MEFEDFRERVQAEREVRAQRDAAERNIPAERLRREIREAFARQDADGPEAAQREAASDDDG
jgi:hypothetical protein